MTSDDKKPDSTRGRGGENPWDNPDLPSREVDSGVRGDGKRSPERKQRPRKGD